MIQLWLERNYGIKADEEIKIGNYSACRRGDQLYFLIRPVNKDTDELSELQTIALHLSQNGDSSVPLFFPAKNGELLSQWENDKACVLVSKSVERRKITKLGRKLGKFHKRGRSLQYPIKKISRLGQWKELWEKRLDQMENVWNGKLFQFPENEFERMFLESFPYYMGLAENAIQYLVDTELDETPTEIDHGTICHERFSSSTWGDSILTKNPFEWVLDHGSRDLAEWTRERYFYNTQTYEPDLKGFFADYQSTTKLSPFSWRLLYARMLFPLHYFESVEGYYLTQSEQTRNSLEDQMLKLLNQSGEYEQFLRNFYHVIEAPIRTRNIPEVEWLKRL
ncbi:spore coat putative kinase YutH [Bacillus sp. 1NLA3E]|uniref:spore coat putative kinase YutH n=1 Tax=Bacillus sp. 1NLA3E TaxID=666686 RepID=UPI000247F38A|nr:spore coat protein YutH [Bacillus sp. 1NLA3E]AGK55479.1 spore coat protein YutH [Bacillus sp. 1NLA3E]